MIFVTNWLRVWSKPNIDDNLIFTALADPTRRRILELLDRAPRPVELLAAEFAMSRPAVSKHLAALRVAGLVSCTSAGRQNVYALERAALRSVESWLNQFWSGRLDLLRRIAEGDG